jgi:cobalt/nickel transport system permease protein
MTPLLPPLWAVHIGDGQLTFSWCVAGFVAAGLLALLGAWRIHEDEIPQLAVLTAAFFLTALIHVPVPAGPRTHLLLNGLLGVVLGRRAILAVLVGLFLQSSLSVMEGVGFSTLGVNACVMALPAYLAWGLFAGMQRVPWIHEPALRSGLVAFCTVLATLSMVYAVTALITNWGSAALTPDLSAANRVTFYPLTIVNQGTFFPLTILGAFSLGFLSTLSFVAFFPLTILGAILLAAVAAWAERRLDHAVEFPLGLLVGEISVLATILLNGLVLILGGTENWSTLVLLTFVIHLPLAVVEGIILGFTVGFLALVKPQLLCGYRPRAREVALLLAPLALLAFTPPVSAHHLLADFDVKPDRRIVIESWFDIPGENGDAPRGAKVLVYRADGSLLVEGVTDAKGLYAFSFEKAEPLKVVVNAGQGHVKELHIPKERLEPYATSDAAPTEHGTSAPTAESFADRSSRFQFRDVLIAFGFIFGLAAFILSLRNGLALRALRRDEERRRD